MDESHFVPFQGLKHTKSRGCAVKDMWILFLICIHITYELISIRIHILRFLCNRLFTFNILLGTDAMTLKDAQRRLIKNNNNRPRDPNVLDVRRTSTRPPSSDLKCPMQIIIFLGQDDCFYLSTKSCLNHCHHPALKVDAILRGQNDM